MFRSLTMLIEGNSNWRQIGSVNMSGFNHTCELIRDCTVNSYIQESHAFDQHSKPVFVEPGKHCNWWDSVEQWKHEIIPGFVSACASGRHTRED